MQQFSTLGGPLRHWLAVGTVSVVTALTTLTPARDARAEPSDIAAAEVLFRDGKRLLAQKDYEQACPKLAESQRLDPATGTLLALALCHEAQGRTATAWAEFTEAAVRARKEGRPDRQQAAMDWAAKLEPKLSTLTLLVPDSIGKTAGATVNRDGRSVGSAAWGAAVPVDPGEHVVELLVPGKQPWKATPMVGAQADRNVVRLPSPRELADAPAPVVHPSASRSGGPPNAVAERVALPTESHSLSALQWTGVVAAVAGVAAAGFGTYFGLEAIEKNNSSKQQCVDNSCTDEGTRIRHDALANGDRATIAFVTAGALVVAGATLFFVGGKKASSTGNVEAIPAVGERELGMVLRSSF